MTGNGWTQEDVYLMSAEDVVQCLTAMEDRNNRQAKRIAWLEKELKDTVEKNEVLTIEISELEEYAVGCTDPRCYR